MEQISFRLRDHKSFTASQLHYCIFDSITLSAIPTVAGSTTMKLSQILTTICCYTIFFVFATSSSIEAATNGQPSERSVNSIDVSMNSYSGYVTGTYPATQISSSLLTSPSVSRRANLTAPTTSASTRWRSILQLVR